VFDFVQITKLQAPNSRAGPNLKHQPPKTGAEANGARLVFELGAWRLVFLWSLGFGIWNLELVAPSLLKE
jgi:hypothetical protein